MTTDSRENGHRQRPVVNESAERVQGKETWIEFPIDGIGLKIFGHEDSG